MAIIILKKYLQNRKCFLEAAVSTCVYILVSDARNNSCDVSRQLRRPNSAFWVQLKMAAPLQKCWRSASSEKFPELFEISSKTVARSRLPGPLVRRRSPREPSHW